MKNTFAIIVVVVFLSVSAFFGRMFLAGSDNDTWVCQDGAWIKDGNPNEPMPTDPCPTDAVACTMEAKICPDGSAVGRSGADCSFALCPKEDLIKVTSLTAYSNISSPLRVEGEARGYWFFEASFPVRLYDENNNLLATAIAQAQGEWMTEEFVPFLAELVFETPDSETGFLVLEKDNPSGLPENADELRIPIVFEDDTKEISLFYYNPELDKDASGNVMCSDAGLVAVSREIANSDTLVQDSIELLLEGKLTTEEKKEGIGTEYPLPGFSLESAVLKDGVLTITFNDPSNKSVGGACRVGILWSQIEATAKQFAEVKEVKFLPEDIFQP